MNKNIAIKLVKMANQLDYIVKMANELDCNGFAKEAKVLDDALLKIANMETFLQEEVPRLYESQPYPPKRVNPAPFQTGGWNDHPQRPKEIEELANKILEEIHIMKQIVDKLEKDQEWNLISEKIVKDWVSTVNNFSKTFEKEFEKGLIWSSNEVVKKMLLYKSNESINLLQELRKINTDYDIKKYYKQHKEYFGY